ncbi:MAG: hypothetical protein AVDCRST_MAG56-4484, partial [uncultured Cytophagales bacterium]
LFIQQCTLGATGHALQIFSKPVGSQPGHFAGLAGLFEQVGSPRHDGQFFGKNFTMLRQVEAVAGMGSWVEGTAFRVYFKQTI